MRKAIVAGVILLSVGVAGCGGSSSGSSSSGGSKTEQAATCLKNALANQALGNGTNCADPTAAKVEGETQQSINVQCTAQNGNVYVCDVTGPGTKNPYDSSLPGSVRGGFYQVTYDGSSIVYQLQQNG